MKIFLICPVRNADDEIKNKLKAYIESLEEQGHKVYYPARDTNQNDSTGFKICLANRSAIESCNEVHIFWDGKSQGSLFDLGMAFAFIKPLKIVQVPPKTEGKSFQNMMHIWEKEFPPF